MGIAIYPNIGKQTQLGQQLILPARQTGIFHFVTKGLGSDARMLVGGPAETRKRSASVPLRLVV